ncbi:MAG: hypothetical protein LUE25_04495 [Clostridiales bacterium]|nr:hypothetical protein [Clostridiales bacterium]
MKKALVIILAVLCALAVLSSCGESEESEKITMTVTTENITAATETLEISIKNNTGTEYGYGLTLSLYRLDGEEWTSVGAISGWSEIAYELKSKSTNTQTISVTNKYGSLEAGEYKIVKSFSDSDGGTVEAEAFFTVGE